MGLRETVGLACHFALLLLCIGLLFAADSSGPFVQETLRPFAGDALKLIIGATVGFIGATFGGRK